MTRTRDARVQAMWDLGGFGSGHGLEIGPLHRTIVHRDEADVAYLDVMDKPALDEHYGPDPAVDVDLIPEIDYALIQDGTTRSLAEACAPGAPFDWVVASHVVEHVPDLIGWLADVAEVVRDDGSLVLVVPDGRYTFDVHRPTTTIGAMVQAHADGDRTPSLRAVYDHFASAASVDPRELWKGARPGLDRRIHGPAYADQMVATAATGEYVDCHVWVFTPEVFLLQMHELRTGGRSAWFVEELRPTPRNDLEFMVRLRRMPRGEESAGPLADEVLPTEDRPDWMAVLDRREEGVRRLRARVAQQRAEIEALRSSRSYRLGNAVVRPVSRSLSRLRRR